MPTHGTPSVKINPHFDGPGFYLRKHRHFITILLLFFITILLL